MKIELDFSKLFRAVTKRHLNGLLTTALMEFETLLAEQYRADGKDIDYITIRKKLLDRHGAAVREIEELCEQINKF